MTKKHFRVSLFDSYQLANCAEKLALLALQSNGDRDISLDQLEMVAKANVIQYPSMNDRLTIERIGENLLHIDRKMGSGEIKTLLIIEEVEIF